MSSSDQEGSSPGEPDCAYSQHFFNVLPAHLIRQYVDKDGCRRCRRQLFDLSDEMATKLDIEFYQDGRDALLKALTE